jgi:uncharacterized Rossmann fold enzyme
LEFANWFPLYLQILSKLNLDIQKDFSSSLILSKLVSVNDKDITLQLLKKMIGQRTLVIGAGPSLNNHLVQKFIADHSCHSIIAADGATELCLKLNVIPNFIVTDLDGHVKSLIEANDRGSTLLIHGHGDNIDKVIKHVSRFNNVIATTQVFPLSNVFNFGGFTDGDRCVFLADEFKSPEIWLVGMDFDLPPGYFSKKGLISHELKMKKLSIGKQLVGYLARRSSSKILNVATRPSFNSLISGVTNLRLS